MHFVSITFEGCNQPVPWFVFDFVAGNGPTLNELLDPIVEGLLEYGVVLETLVADGKEQHFLRGQVGTGGLVK